MGYLCYERKTWIMNMVTFPVIQFRHESLVLVPKSESKLGLARKRGKVIMSGSPHSRVPSPFGKAERPRQKLT